MTAVMGPSGAGKSTFVTTLAGKATYGEQTGKIYLNGVEDSLTRYKSLVGFVPQEVSLFVEHSLLCVCESVFNPVCARNRTL